MSEEPWLRGPLPGIHPLLAPLLFSFQMAREDVRHWTEGLTSEELWAQPHGLSAVGFHIRHIGGSVERLMTYALGGLLTAHQLVEVKEETRPGASLPQLLSVLESRLDAAEAAVRSLDPSRLAEPRAVGRKQLPSTLGGLLTHIAEHTQRHLGQAIVTAKLVKALRER